jgi:hypothetical protein
VKKLDQQERLITGTAWAHPQGLNSERWPFFVTSASVVPIVRISFGFAHVQFYPTRWCSIVVGVWIW